MFFEGERIFPEFLTKILADYKIADHHIAGQSNGGISAFDVAASGRHDLSIHSRRPWVVLTDARDVIQTLFALEEILQQLTARSH